MMGTSSRLDVVAELRCNARFVSVAKGAAPNIKRQLYQLLRSGASPAIIQGARHIKRLVPHRMLGVDRTQDRNLSRARGPDARRMLLGAGYCSTASGPFREHSLLTRRGKMHYRARLRPALAAITPQSMEGSLLFWTWFGVAVLLGIAAAADILGNGPQAYLGGLLTGAVYLIAYKSILTMKSSDVQRSAAPLNEERFTPPQKHREVLDRPAPRNSPTSTSRNGRGRSDPKPSMLQWLKGLARRIR
jgi:hypothetical protein